MKLLISCSFLFALVCCTTQKKQEPVANYDSTRVTDTTKDVASVIRYYEEADTVDQNQLSFIEERGELLLEIPDQQSFVSDPYDFPLDPEIIANILGEGSDITQEVTEGGEDEDGEPYGSYTYYTIQSRDSKVSFYSYPGKHYATIKTALLPLKNGILVGITKHALLDNMALQDSLSKATLFRFRNDYGYLDLLFRADTLNTIEVYYEEGT